MPRWGPSGLNTFGAVDQRLSEVGQPPVAGSGGTAQDGEGLFDVDLQPLGEQAFRSAASAGPSARVTATAVASTGDRDDDGTDMAKPAADPRRGQFRDNQH